MGSQDVPSAWTDLHVPRPSLVRRLRTARVAVVQAGGGFGKSSLAAEVTRRHSGEAVLRTIGDRDGHPGPLLEHLLTPVGLQRMASDVDDDLAADRLAGRIAEGFALRRLPILLVVDEADPRHGRVLSVLARGIPPPHRLLILSRQDPFSLDGWATGDRTVLRQADLAFAVDDLQRMLDAAGVTVLPAALVQSLVQATSGWVTALRAITAILAGSASPVAQARALLDHNVVLGDLVDRLLAPLDGGVRAALAQAALLPALDRQTAEALGLADALRASHRSGMPWELPDVGPWTLADPLVEQLTQHVRPDPGLSERAAEVYASQGRYVQAVAVLRGVGRDEAAAAVIARAPITELRELPGTDVIDAIETLPASARSAHPWVEVQLARLLTVRNEYNRRNELIAAGVAAHAGDHPEVGLALEAERFRDLAYFSPHPDPVEVARIRQLLPQAGEDQTSRGLLEEGLALLTLRAGGDHALATAEGHLRRAADCFDVAGDLRLHASALRNLAWHVHLERGRLDLVIETFDRIEARLGGDGRFFSWRNNRAEAHLFGGDLAAAAADLAEAGRLAELFHDDLTLSYVAWSTAMLESMRGEPMRTLAAVARADRLAGDWYTTATGALFLAQTTEALARAGLEQDARERLARTVARRDEDRRQVGLAEFGVAARFGDAAAARRMHDELLEDGPIEPLEAPRVLLLLALAIHRCGDADTAARTAARALVAYDALGLLDAAAVHEPDAARVLIPLAAREGAPVPARGRDAGAAAAAVRPDALAGARPEEVAARLGLRTREAEVLLALRSGGSNAAIARQMGVAESTVRKHLQHVYKTLGLRSRSEALVMLAGGTIPAPSDDAG